jgi:hypothetical protein
MSILDIQISQTGLVGVIPAVCYIATNDTEATVLTTGYLNKAVAQGFSFPIPSIACVSTETSVGAAPDVGWFEIKHSGSNWSLVRTVSPGSVILPTILNHIATYADVDGTLTEDPSLALTNGSIQTLGGGYITGKTTGGFAGNIIMYPITSTRGLFQIFATANTGNTNLTLTNSPMGQTTALTIPDPGASAANLILSKSAGTQHITTGAFQVDAGVISSGISTGGTAGGFIAYPATASNGSLRLTPIGNAGNFAATISNVSTLGQASVYTIPDPAAATANFAVAPSALVSGNLVKASGTAGLIIDAGVSSTLVDTSLSSATAATNKIFVKTITAGFAALATAGHVAVMANTSGTSQFKVMNIRVMYTASGLSGGGGDRLLSLTDGTIVFNQAGITAALLGTPVYTLWGGTGNPLPGSVSTISTAGAAIYLVYSGGATDYTAGSVTIEIELAQVTA